MRTVTGYIDGKPQWSENQPAYGGSIKLGGALVQGESGSRERQRVAEREHKARLRELSTEFPPSGNTRSGFVEDFGDKRLVSDTRTPENHGVNPNPQRSAP